MKTSVKILVWLGVSSLNPQGQAPLNCRITVAGKRAELRTGHWVEPKDWNEARKKVVGNGPAARTINAGLTKMVDQLTDLWADLERQGKPVTARVMARLYRTNGAVMNLLDLFDAFNQERTTLLNVELSKASVALSRQRRTTLHAFLAARNLTGLRPEEFTPNMADKFVHWSGVEKGHQRTYTNKMLSVFNQLLRWGVRREYLIENPLRHYQLKHVAPGEIKYLTVGELQALSTVALPTHALERARDCFVFQCWTGLAFADLRALHVGRDAEYQRDGQGVLRRVLRVRRQKSTLFKGYEAVVPLLPEAERILAQYGDVLPTKSNQLYNADLKLVGQACGIGAEKMASHVGRKTAGVMMLNLGIRMETVSKFLGHSSVKMTEKIYAKILDTTVVDDFGKLFGAAGGLAAAPAPLALPLPASDTRWQQQPVADLRPAKRLILS